MAKKAKKRLWDDWGDRPLPPEVIASLNRQMEDIENQPRRPLGEVLDEVRQKLQEIIDAQSLDQPPGDRAVA